MNLDMNQSCAIGAIVPGVDGLEAVDYRLEDGQARVRFRQTCVPDATGERGPNRPGPSPVPRCNDLSDKRRH